MIKERVVNYDQTNIDRNENDEPLTDGTKTNTSSHLSVRRPTYAEVLNHT